ncbi:transporter family-2 protein [Allocatelliglobosispora scoriae]|uniref:Transporter family-2 protein n=1 Tax=Allocatelliglobosispora scoriae TaxID=643052 RepID=A0A841BW06_9ACTN|nr:DMT family transporter [Allocatelliglobosispora scoriae]MBB5871648.1 transporter family-2 protein [Allocatelliglobosispora scoriae]
MTGSRTRTLGIFAAFLGGIGAAVQARINGELGARLNDGIAAAVISFGSGLVLLTIAVLALPAGRAGLGLVAAKLRDGRMRAWECLGGACGALLVASQGLTVATLGVATFTVAVVAGQTGSGLAVDRAGIGPGGVRPITTQRALGAALTVVAVLIAVSNHLGAPGSLLLAILPLVAGAGMAWQAAANGRVRAASGGVLPTTFINFAVGTTALLLAFAVSLAVRGVPTGSLPTELWLYLGGILGVGFIAMAAAVVRHIGVLLLGLGMIAGQVSGALILDQFAPGRAGQPSASTLLGAALTLVAVAIAGRSGKARPSS